MHNFEIAFRTEYDDGYSAGNGGNFIRIIAAEDIFMADKIAQAMVGELIGDQLWLVEVLCVEKTEKEPRIPSLMDNIILWARILKKIGYSRKPLRFIYSYRIEKNEIVGFYLYRPELYKL